MEITLNSWGRGRDAAKLFGGKNIPEFLSQAPSADFLRH